ncbi:hypothetical protein C0992_004476 [Termitomyces sp. T32_za158]|nr:hypothetical protein C0992_004476 [Termitomyces sp. T32_za158]
MSLLTSKWEELLLHYTPFNLEFYGALVIQLIFFWGISAAYLALPYISPAFSARHKLQNQAKQPKPSELWDCLWITARNQAVSTLLHIAVLKLGVFLGRPPSYRFDAVLPGASEIIRDLVACCILREVMFYYTHRVFHHPTLYPHREFRDHWGVGLVPWYQHKRSKGENNLKGCKSARISVYQ